MSYRLFGAETSAYSTKMRSYLKYKSVPFDWVPRTQETEDELKRVSRFATLPVLVTASGFAVHDTTPLIEALEADSPEPSATPADPTLGFLACVLEEYADAWLAKTVFHYRWTRKKDQRLAAQRTIDDYYTVTPPADRKAAEDLAIETMGAQLKTMQLDGELGDALEKSFKRFVKLLDEHLKKHLFIFGERPSIADFAIAGQLIQMMKDPTPGQDHREGRPVRRQMVRVHDRADRIGPLRRVRGPEGYAQRRSSPTISACSSCRGRRRISRTRSPARRPSRSRSARMPSRLPRCAPPRVPSASCAASS